MGLTAATLAAAASPSPIASPRPPAPSAAWLARAPADAVLDGLRRAADPVAALHALERLLSRRRRRRRAARSAAARARREPVARGDARVARAPRGRALVARMLDEPRRSVAEHVGGAHRARRRRRRCRAPSCRPSCGAIVGRSSCASAGAISSGSGPSTTPCASSPRSPRPLIDVATRSVRARVAGEWGGDTPVGFAVLGMGKLGGEELNYSSDVDLVYVYGEEADHPGGEARCGSSSRRSARRSRRRSPR